MQKCDYSNNLLDMAYKTHRFGIHLLNSNLLVLFLDFYLNTINHYLAILKHKQIWLNYESKA